MTHDLQGTVNVLTERISQILDSDNSLTDINMGSKAGRQMVAAAIARQLIDGGDHFIPKFSLPNVL
jgi:hypothetical protein